MFLRKPSCQVESAENFQKEFLQGLKIKGIFAWVGKQDQISNEAKRHSNFLTVFPPLFCLKILGLFKPLCFCCMGLTETVLLVLVSGPETKHHIRSKQVIDFVICVSYCVIYNIFLQYTERWQQQCCRAFRSISMVSNHEKVSWSSNGNEVGEVKAAHFLPCCCTHSFHSQSCKHTADFTGADWKGKEQSLPESCRI